MTRLSTIAEFNDPRLVAVYDTINPYEPGTQPDLYRSLAREVGASTVLELGCGTGQVACAFAAEGFRVTGVEPSAAMLSVARTRCVGVEWVHGGAAALGTLNADFAYMSGHVAQFFVTDEEWEDALSALRRALRPGGWLSFEARDPRAREWERWARSVRTSVVDPVAGPIEWWTEVHDVRGGVVSYAIHYRFLARDETLVSEAALRFRTEEELRASLGEAGFAVECMYGNWDRAPIGNGAPELIVLAHAQ
ncbi:MAG TPA: methyltransferase domain-containing protein [Acidimicrobiia bacterium]|nr:methyltransferase domain-containing protein [Acidimicrobiia bacterium]